MNSCLLTNIPSSIIAANFKRTSPGRIASVEKDASRSLIAHIQASSPPAAFAVLSDQCLAKLLIGSKLSTASFSSSKLGIICSRCNALKTSST